MKTSTETLLGIYFDLLLVIKNKRNMPFRTLGKTTRFPFVDMLEFIIGARIYRMSFDIRKMITRDGEITFINVIICIKF